MYVCMYYTLKLAIHNVFICVKIQQQLCALCDILSRRFIVNMLDEALSRHTLPRITGQRVLEIYDERRWCMGLQSFTPCGNKRSRPYASLFVSAGNNNSLAKGNNPLHQFPRSKSTTSPQQVGSFPYGEVTGKRV